MTSAETVYGGQPPAGSLPPLPNGPGHTVTVVGQPAPHHAGILPVTGLDWFWIGFAVLLMCGLAVLCTVGARGNR